MPFDKQLLVLHLPLVARVPSSLPCYVGSESAKIFSVGVTHTRTFASPASFRSIEGHNHLFGLNDLFFGVLLGDLFSDRSFLLGVQFEGVLVVFELQFKAKVGTDVGPAGANMLDGGSKGHLIFFHVVGNNKGG